jgi:hypothetical protein
MVFVRQGYSLEKYIPKMKDKGVHLRWELNRIAEPRYFYAVPGKYFDAAHKMFRSE